MVDLAYGYEWNKLGLYGCANVQIDDDQQTLSLFMPHRGYPQLGLNRYR